MVRKIVLNLSILQTCRPNIKTIVYRKQQQQQLTTLVQVCGSVDDRSQQTQQCDKDGPLYSGGAAAVIGHYVLSCFDVSPDVEDELKLRLTSMRVCVYSMDIKKLYDGNLWPMGVVVRPWKFKHRS